MTRDMTDGMKNNRIVHGTKNYSILGTLLHFALANGQIVDTMHSVHIGVGNTHYRIITGQCIQEKKNDTTVDLTKFVV